MADPPHTQDLGDPDATLPPEGRTATPTVAMGPGVKIDRYTVIERVGAGAMGVVYSAWDAELDRRVALKVVQGAYGHRADLLREAKALAKLSHPNVVAVFDVGTHHDGMFIAMEYVRGQTLARWREANPDASADAVLRLYREAGAGLAAAHEAGLIHRDFKPANVMVTEEGAVKVLDFGIAQIDGQEDSSRAGTPRYMAPEQLMGAADARSDQFSFAMALYEALFRELPFGGRTSLEASASLLSADFSKLSEIRHAPAHVQDALARALSADPGDRFGSMQDLLDALTPSEPTGGRRLGWLLGASAAIGGLLVWGTGRGEDPCGAAASSIASTWSDEQRQRVADNLEDERVEPHLAERALEQSEAFVRAWTQGRLDACRAANVLHTQTQPTMELRYRCLDQRLDRFSVVVDTLATDTGAIKLALADVLQEIPTLRRCADVDALRASFPPPEDPDDQARARDLALRLAEAKALRTWEPTEALERVEELREEIEALDYPPLRVNLRVLEGTMLAFLGRRREGVALVEEAVELGVEFNARVVTVDALFELARQRSAYDKDIQSALFLERLAIAIARGLPSLPELPRRGFQARMEIYINGAMAEEAVDVGRAWIEDIRARGEYQTLEGIHARTRMAFALTGVGAYGEAEALLEALLQDPSIGDGHPLIARSYTYRARLRTERGDYDGALADHLAAHERFVALYGETHVNAAGRLGDATRTLVEANRLDEAVTMAQRALSALSSGPEATPPNPTIIASEYLAEAAYNLGRYDLAIEALDEADRQGRKIRGDFPTWRQLARGRIAEARGDLTLAREFFTRVVTQAPDPNDQASGRLGLYLADIAQGQGAARKAELLELLDDDQLTAATRARAAWGLAMLEARRGQPATARRHLQRARSLIEDRPWERMLRRKLDAVERALGP